MARSYNISNVASDLVESLIEVRAVILVSSMLVCLL